MSFLRPLTLLAFSLTATSITQGQVQHIGMTPEQEFLLCAQQVMGKTVLWSGIFDTREAGANPVPRVPCPALREEFIRLLKENAGILTLEDGGFAYLEVHWVPTTGLQSGPVYDGGTPPFKVDFDVRKGERSDRKLSEQELQTISKKILGKTRGVEVLWDIQDPPCIGRIEVQLNIEAHRLSKQGPESIISFLRVSDCPGKRLDHPPGYISDMTRLIYGEVKNGEYEMLWDSPLLFAPPNWISYRDLNGDGTAEILVWPSKLDYQFPEDSARFGYAVGVVAFDVTGREITRQTDCKHYYYLPDNAACPIVARKTRLVQSKNGRQMEILATGWVDDSVSGATKRVRRFSLIDGHYRPQ
ncbi:MAG: hypothetical protein ABSG02_00915 [Terriglobales bacterium]